MIVVLSFDEELVAKIVKKISKFLRQQFFFPGPMEPHPDHRNTALVVWSALQAIESSHRPDAYSYEISVQSPINILVDITAQAEEKAKVMSMYESQNKQNNYEELVTALDKGRTFSLSSDINYAEGFYRYSQNQLTKDLTGVLIDLVKAYFHFS
jgi:LmbE family N-acetylglucosaminyl deacetylase